MTKPTGLTDEDVRELNIKPMTKNQRYKMSLKYKQQQERGSVLCRHLKEFDAKDIIRDFDGLTIDETYYVCIQCKEKVDRFEIERIDKFLQDKYNKTLKINYL